MPPPFTVCSQPQVHPRRQVRSPCACADDGKELVNSEGGDRCSDPVAPRDCPPPKAQSGAMTSTAGGGRRSAWQDVVINSWNLGQVWVLPAPRMSFELAHSGSWGPACPLCPAMLPVQVHPPHSPPRKGCPSPCTRLGILQLCLSFRDISNSMFLFHPHCFPRSVAQYIHLQDLLLWQ